MYLLYRANLENVKWYEYQLFKIIYIIVSKWSNFIQIYNYLGLILQVMFFQK